MNQIIKTYNLILTLVLLNNLGNVEGIKSAEKGKYIPGYCIQPTIYMLSESKLF